MRRQFLSVVMVLSLGMAGLLGVGWIGSVDNSFDFVVGQRELDHLPQNMWTTRQSVLSIFVVAGRLGVVWWPEVIEGRVERIDRTFFMGRSPAAGYAKFGTIPIWPPILALVGVGVGSWFGSRRPAVAGAMFRPRRRVAAWLVPLAAGIATVAFVVAAVFCARSYFCFNRLDLRLLPGPAALQLNNSRGSLMFAWTEAGPATTLTGGKLAFTRWVITPTPGPLYQSAELKGPYFRLFGFFIGTDGTTPLFRNVIILPYWLVLLATGALSGRLIVRWIRSRNIERAAAGGLCAGCGYDLRGSRERCPECGLQINAAATA